MPAVPSAAALAACIATRRLLAHGFSSVLTSTVRMPNPPKLLPMTTSFGYTPPTPHRLPPPIQPPPQLRPCPAPAPPRSAAHPLAARHEALRLRHVCARRLVRLHANLLEQVRLLAVHVLADGAPGEGGGGRGGEAGGSRWLAWEAWMSRAGFMRSCKLGNSAASHTQTQVFC